MFLMTLFLCFWNKAFDIFRKGLYHLCILIGPVVYQQCNHTYAHEGFRVLCMINSKWASVCNQQNYCITKGLDIRWMCWNVAYFLPAFRCQYSQIFCSYLRLVFFTYYLSFMWPTVLPFHQWDFFFSFIFFSLLFLSLVGFLSLTHEFVFCWFKMV